MNSEARIQPVRAGRKPQYAESRIFYQSEAPELRENPDNPYPPNANAPSCRRHASRSLHMMDRMASQMKGKRITLRFSRRMSAEFPTPYCRFGASAIQIHCALIQAIFNTVSSAENSDDALHQRLKPARHASTTEDKHLFQSDTGWIAVKPHVTIHADVEMESKCRAFITPNH